MPRAILFDLLTALLDSWTLWSEIAGSAERGLAWRKSYLEVTYGCGDYRDYESLVAESAARAGFPKQWAAELTSRWDELTPWPGVPETLAQLRGRIPIAVVTNCSEALAKRATARAGVFDVMVSAERAGAYKPDPRPYQIALSELGVEPRDTIFVAGSAWDLPGAGRLGMPVFWHNRIGLKAPDGAPQPLLESARIEGLLTLL